MIQNIASGERLTPPMMGLYTPNRVFTNVMPPSVYRSLTAKLRFNAVSELSFIVDKKITSATGKVIENPVYNLLKKNKLIRVDDYDDAYKWWVVVSPDEDIEGESESKTVTCYSYEYTLNGKSVNIAAGTYKFYDIVNTDQTLLGIVSAQLSGWSIGHVDTALYKYVVVNSSNEESTQYVYRYLDIPDEPMYSFLASTVEQKFNCIILFDTENKTINAYTPGNAVKSSEIVLTRESLIDKVEIKTDDSDLITALSVTGSEDFDIAHVNPLGNTMLYDFDYYKTTEWMSQSLIDAIDAWEAVVAAQQTTYESKLLLYKEALAALLVVKDELIELQAQLSAKELLRSNQMLLDFSVQENAAAYSATVSEIASLDASIAAKTAEVSAAQASVDGYSADLDTCVAAVSFDSNFTTAQLAELDNLVFIGTYSNSSYIQTDTMSEDYKITLGEELLEEGRDKLSLLSQPSYTLSMSLANFLAMIGFQKYKNDINTGITVLAELKHNDWIQPILLEISMDYDNPDNLSITFGNRYRISDAEWTLSELQAETVKTNGFLNVNSEIMSRPYKSGLTDEVTAYMKSALSLTAQEIYNSTDEEFVIGSYGIWGKKKLGNGSYDPCQMRMYHKGIALTSDAWETVSLAVGEVTVNNEKKMAVIADVISGNILLGNAVEITNSNNTFSISDAGLSFESGDTLFSINSTSGVTIENASFSVENTMNRILIDADNGIKIQKRLDATNYIDVFYADAGGNLTMSGNITLGGSDDVYGTLYTKNADGDTIVSISSGGLQINNARFSMVQRFESGFYTTFSVNHSVTGGVMYDWANFYMDSVSFVKLTKNAGGVPVVLAGATETMLDGSAIKHSYYDASGNRILCGQVAADISTTGLIVSASQLDIATSTITMTNGDGAFKATAGSLILSAGANGAYNLQLWGSPISVYANGNYYTLAFNNGYVMYY